MDKVYPLLSPKPEAQQFLDEENGYGNLRSAARDPYQVGAEIDNLRSTSCSGAPSPDAGRPSRTNMPLSSHEDYLGDLGINDLRSPSPEARHYFSPNSGASAPLLLHKDILDSLGINDLRSPPPSARQCSSPEFGVVSSREGNLDELELNNLRSPPHARCFSSPLSRANVPLSSREDDLRDLDATGIEDPRSPSESPDARRFPTPTSGASSPHSSRVDVLEYLGIGGLRCPSPNARSFSAPIPHANSPLSSRVDILDELGIGKLRSPSPNARRFCPPVICENSPRSSREEVLDELGINGLFPPSPEPGRLSSPAAEAPEDADLDSTNIRSKSHFHVSSKSLNLIPGMQCGNGESSHLLPWTASEGLAVMIRIRTVIIDIRVTIAVNGRLKYEQQSKS